MQINCVISEAQLPIHFRCYIFFDTVSRLKWRPVQGVPLLSPSVSRDRLILVCATVCNKRSLTYSDIWVIDNSHFCSGLVLTMGEVAVTFIDDSCISLIKLMSSYYPVLFLPPPDSSWWLGWLSCSKLSTIEQYDNGNNCPTLFQSFQKHLSVLSRKREDTVESPKKVVLFDIQFPNVKNEFPCSKSKSKYYNITCTPKHVFHQPFITSHLQPSLQFLSLYLGTLMLNLQPSQVSLFCVKTHTVYSKAEVVS